MRVPPLVREFLEWRWAPCVALVAGSLAFVGLALLLIPSQLEGAPRSASQAGFDQPPPAARALFGASVAQGASLAQGATLTAEHASDEARAASLRLPPVPAAAPEVQQARGFSPIIERADRPPPPDTPPPPPPPVAPAPPPAPEVTPPPAPPAAVPPAAVPPAAALPQGVVPPADPDAPHREN